MSFVKYSGQTPPRKLKKTGTGKEELSMISPELLFTMGIKKGKIMKKFILLLLVVIISGCAAKSGVVQVDTDTFMISRKAAIGFSNLDNLKAETFQEADEYCKSQNRRISIVNTIDSPPAYFLGKSPKVEVRFMCLKKKEIPGTPTLQ